MKTLISEKLTNLRLENGLTQKELAVNINSTNKNIWAYENGIATPPYDVLVAYAQFFNVSADYLLGLEDDFGIKKSAGASAPTFTREEMDLVFKFRELPEQLKAIVKQQLDVFSTPETLFENTEKSH